MPMFALEQNECTINHVNSRKEVHGEDLVPACDMQFSCDLANTILDVFDYALRPALYAADPTADAVDPAHLPLLRFAKLGVLLWDLEITGCQITIHRGFSGKSDIVLPSAKVNRFKITCKEGGTVQVDFRAQFRVASPAQSGELDWLIQEKCPITLVPKAFQEEVDKTEQRTRAVDPNQGDLGLGGSEPADDLLAARSDCLQLLQDAGYFAISTDVLDGWSAQEIAQVRVYLLQLKTEIGDAGIPPCLQAWLDGLDGHQRMQDQERAAGEPVIE